MRRLFSPLTMLRRGPALALALLTSLFVAPALRPAPRPVAVPAAVVAPSAGEESAEAEWMTEARAERGKLLTRVGVEGWHARGHRGTVNTASSATSRQRSGIPPILHERNPPFPINVTMRDRKSQNVDRRVKSKATTQWRKTESANGGQLEGGASDNRSS